jgi:hypothetical protein
LVLLRLTNINANKRIGRTLRRYPIFRRDVHYEPEDGWRYYMHSATHFQYNVTSQDRDFHRLHVKIGEFLQPSFFVRVLFSTNFIG